jgi:ATP-dependent DNA helicase RecG
VEPEKKSALKLGKLKQLGPATLSQVPLLLPNDWDDLRFPVEHFDAIHRVPEGTKLLVRGTIQSEPSVRFGKPPRTTIFIADECGYTIGTIFFGDTRQLGLVRGKHVSITGNARAFNNQIWLNNPEIVESEWVGRLRPKYPGKPKIIKPETVRQNVVSLLPVFIPEASRYFESHIEKLIPVPVLMAMLNLPNVTLEKVIRVAHVPRTIAAGLKAQEALGTMAAFCRLGEVARFQAPVRQSRLSVSKVMAPTIIQNLPFALDAGQHDAVRDILDRAGGSTAMRHMISGDVGSGKTAVFGCVAAAIARAGGRVAIMAPMGVLANQSLEAIKAFWPDLRCELVIGDPKAKLDHEKRDRVLSAQVVAGSTALLFQDVGTFDLVIIDEQQRFSRDQREGLIRRGDEHLIEVTATCIPRSMALLKYGQWSFSRLRGDHVTKNITTEIVCSRQYKQEAGQMIMSRVNETLANQRQVLIIYPLREDAEESSGPPRSVRAAEKIFQRMFPGQVLSIDGSRSAAEKESVIEQMKQGKARILIATSVVEVGLDIPGLQRVVVVNPERMGLSALHQIRGRVARTGGQGYMDLYAPDVLADHSRTRLEVLVETQDGFELTERDMALRGVGSLASDSDQQTGADESLLFGRPITIDMLQTASSIIESLKDSLKKADIGAI